MSSTEKKLEKSKQHVSEKKIDKVESLPLDRKPAQLISEEVNSLILLPVNEDSRNLIVKMSVAKNFLTMYLNNQTTNPTFLEFNWLWNSYRKEYEAIRGNHDSHVLMHEEDLNVGKEKFHEHIEFKEVSSISQEDFQVFLNRLYKYQNSYELRKNNTRSSSFRFVLESSRFTQAQWERFPQKTLNEVDDFISAGLSSPPVLDKCLPQPNMSAAWQPFDSFHVTQHTYTREVPVVTEPVVEKFDFSKLLPYGAGIAALAFCLFLYTVLHSSSAEPEPKSHRRTSDKKDGKKTLLAASMSNLLNEVRASSVSAETVGKENSADMQASVLVEGSVDGDQRMDSSLQGSAPTL